MIQDCHGFHRQDHVDINIWTIFLFLNKRSQNHCFTVSRTACLQIPCTFWDNYLFLQSSKTRNVMLTLMWKRSAAMGSVCFIMQTLSSFNKPRSSLTILLRQADISPWNINAHTCRISTFLHNDDYVWKCWSCWIKGMLLCWVAGPCIVRLKAAPLFLQPAIPSGI